MERETRRDRRARFELETLEGRKMLSAGLTPGISPGHFEHRNLLPTAPRPNSLDSTPDAAGHSERPPLRVQARVPRPAPPAITAAVTAGPDVNGFVTGQTFRRAKVSLDIQAGGAVEQTNRADPRGRFAFNLAVGPGSTLFRLTATLGHRSTSTTLTVSRAQSPPNVPPGTPRLPPDIPVGEYDYCYSEDAGEITTDKLLLSFLDTKGSGRFQYAIQTRADPTVPENPFDPNPVQTDFWDVEGHWVANGSKLEFIGKGTHMRTNTAIPSLDEQDAVTEDLVFDYYAMDKGNLDVTLPASFGPVLSPNGPTQNIQLTKIG
jgi:hypothetical protein